MLSSFMAFLIGSSPDLSPYLIVLIPFGFIAGYLMDRLNSVREIWLEQPALIIKTVAIRYMVFLLIGGLFCMAGVLFAAR